ncbi:MAG: nitroreductase family protein [Verrucomicrobiia bacterium]
MEFSRSIIEIIKERSSRRSYTPQPVEAEKVQALRDFFVALKGRFGGGARFVILDTTGWGEGKINALGTYGTIQGARLFIVGIIRRGEHDMEDFGYQFKKIILRATDLGLGTCWIGGIFNRSRFADKAGVREDEVLPAISPLGYATQKRSVADSIVRWSAGSRNRRPWHQLFFHGSFEMALPTGAARRYADPLEMLRLGPSASNRQPWRVVKESGMDIFHFYLRRSRGYDKLIKAVDLQRIDMGIAMSHFELTARELGLCGRWEKMPPSLSPLPERTEYVRSWIAS